MRVTIDGETLYRAYDSTGVWNGFACPRFHKSEAIRIMNDQYGVHKWHEDKEGNLCGVLPENCEEDIDKWGADDKGLYSIGAYCWVWQVADDKADILLQKLFECLSFNNDGCTNDREFIEAISKGWADIEAMYDGKKSIPDEWIAEFKEDPYEGTPQDPNREYYNEFPDIAIPEELLSDGWSDTSWHNDVTASSTYEIAPEFYVIVWVHHDLPSRREFGPTAKKYYVCLEKDCNILNGEGEGYGTDCAKDMIREARRLIAENAPSWRKKYMEENNQ